VHIGHDLTTVTASSRIHSTQPVAYFNEKHINKQPLGFKEGSLLTSQILPSKPTLTVALIKTGNSWPHPLFFYWNAPGKGDWPPRDNSIYIYICITQHINPDIRGKDGVNNADQLIEKSSLLQSL
jgi:hypothetical protein